MKTLIILIIMLFSIIHAQEFTSSTVISLPGKINNYDFADYVSHSNEDTAFLCLEHYHDSVYSIILKQIHPLDHNYITIVSDTSPQVNPTITFTPDYSPLIVWQSKNADHWRLASRTYASDTLSSITLLTDSLSDCINPSLALGKLCWIENGYLKMATINDTLTDIVNIDSNYCANPDFFHNSNAKFGYILYEKNVDSSKIIRSFSYYKDSWMYSTLSDTGRNCKPRYGHDLEVSYQKYADGIWKALLPDRNWISSNQSYNIENPLYFSFLIVGKDESTSLGDPFLVYESDSLQNSKEIFLELFLSDTENQKFNLSNLPGNDRYPYATLISDTVIVLWIHSNSDSAQIMCTKTQFNPEVNKISSERAGITDFSLMQNYPNPFNSCTIISWQVGATYKSPVHIELSIYNISGQKVVTLVSEKQPAGHHSIEWNASAFASGIYFYKLSAGEYIKVRKLLLIK